MQPPFTEHPQRKNFPFLWHITWTFATFAGMHLCFSKLISSDLNCTPKRRCLGLFRHFLLENIVLMRTLGLSWIPITRAKNAAQTQSKNQGSKLNWGETCFLANYKTMLSVSFWTQFQKVCDTLSYLSNIHHIKIYQFRQVTLHVFVIR